VRRANLALVLNHVAERGPISRARIASETGLHKSTVSSLIGELEELGLVHEPAGIGRVPTVGRPATPIALASTTTALGLEIAVDGARAGIEDLTGEVRFEAQLARDLRSSDPGPVLDEVATIAREAFAFARSEGLRVIGAGIAVPGLVGLDARTLLRAPNLGWGEVHVADEVERRLGLPTGVTSLSNEANLAALAELWDGVGRDLTSFVHVTGRSLGIGGGVVIGRELYRGSSGFAGEIGHMIVDRDGVVCACGARGCLETVAGLEAVRRAAGLPAAPQAPSETALAEHLAALATAGEPAVLAAVDRAADALGVALSAVMNVLDVQALVLGGALVPLCPWLIPRVRGVLGKDVLASPLAGFDLRTSSLGALAPTRGAAAVHLRAVLSEPWRVAEAGIAATA
jgi:predicted NBD/HSP70 family sugar kinase